MLVLKSDLVVGVLLLKDELVVNSLVVGVLLLEGACDAGGRPLCSGWAGGKCCVGGGALVLMVGA